MYISCEQFLVEYGELPWGCVIHLHAICCSNGVKVVVRQKLLAPKVVSISTNVYLLQKLVEEIQQMEPDLQLLSENASLLLEGTGPNEETTKSFEANLADEKKRYQDTLESARTMSDLLKSGVVYECLCLYECV